MRKAAGEGAHLLHTSEASLSGHAGSAFKPMMKRDDEIMRWGTPSKHPRQRDGQAEP